MRLSHRQLLNQFALGRKGSLREKAVKAVGGGGDKALTGRWGNCLVRSTRRYIAIQDEHTILGLILLRRV